MATVKKPAKPETALVLRVCNADGTSHNGFKWPLTVGAKVSAPDWKPIAECGNGLHGWLYGQGDHSCANIYPDSKWLVVEVVLADVVMIGGKCKYPSGVLRFFGERKDATDYLIANEPHAKTVVVIGASLVVGDAQTVIAGAIGTATAGYRGTATAGDRGTATAGYRGTATAGYSGTATAGDRGTATAGYSGTATAGYSGTATAGDRGTATAGDSGTATAGDRGTICIKWWDENKSRYRTEIAYVGEDGIKPNVAYNLNGAHKFVEAA